MILNAPLIKKSDLLLLIIIIQTIQSLISYYNNIIIITYFLFININPLNEANPFLEPFALRNDELYIFIVVKETFTIRDAFLNQYIAREIIKASLFNHSLF